MDTPTTTFPSARILAAALLSASAVSGASGLVDGPKLVGAGVANVNDVFYLINFLFAGGPAPSCP
jgi:hypothetical protein